MTNETLRVGKSIPTSLLSRDQDWRLGIIESQIPAMEDFIRESSEKTDCPICANSSVPRGEIRSVIYRSCESCDHLFSEYMPSTAFLSKYYSQANSAQIDSYVNLPLSHSENRQGEIADQKVSFVNDTLGAALNEPDGNSQLWVDIGCGVGDILVSAQRVGYRTLGIETDPTQLRIAEKRGLRVLSEFLTEESQAPIELSSAYVLSLFNVVEHVTDPKIFLEGICDSLPKGAHIVIEVPRFPSLSSVFQLAGIHQIHRYLNPPEHLNIFSDFSMKLLLEKLGFKLRGVWKYGSDAVEAFISIGDNLGWKEGFSAPQVAGAVSQLQTSIDYAGLSDNMIVIGTKL